MTGFWPIVFWLLMLLALIGYLWQPATPTWAPRAHGIVLWILLAILGAYAIGAPGLPGK